VESLTSRQARILCLDTDWEAIAAESEENSNWVTPDNLAYVIYLRVNRGAGGCCSSPSCEPLGAQHKLRQLRTKDVVAFVSNCSFDAATFEIWEHYFTGLGWSGY